MQSGGSEMEALHEAYRQIHVVAGSDDHNHHYSSVGGISSPVSPSSPPPQARQSLQPASTNESGQTLQYCNTAVGNIFFPEGHADLQNVKEEPQIEQLNQNHKYILLSYVKLILRTKCSIERMVNGLAFL